MQIQANARAHERRRDWDQPRPPLRKRGETIIVDGFGVSVRVERGRLLVADGAGRSRRERAFGRASSQIARLVVLGGSGTLSLEALHWLRSVGSALICIDRDGSILCTSGSTRSEARLRRAQALAPYNDSGLSICRYLLAEKVAGQRRLLDQLPPADGAAKAILEHSLTALEQAESIADAVAAEAEAATAYWRSWTNVAARFRAADQRRIPDHWRTVGQRGSPLSGGPRLAVTPAGAILNYAYALLEAESRLACLAVGLDPALAIVHADYRGRDSLPLDLMEAVRPSVDRYLLSFLEERVLRTSDFYETSRGSCRLLAPVTHELAETLPAWRELVAPVAERVASMLVDTGRRARPLPTPLTEANRRSDRARRHGRASAPEAVQSPKPERRCVHCGDELPGRKRRYCDRCLREEQQRQLAHGPAALAALRDSGLDPSNGSASQRLRASTVARQRREQREWQQAHRDTAADPALFERDILPALHAVGIAELARATGLSEPYLRCIRRGERTPHPRHWPALLAAALPTTRGEGGGASED